jgi:hypothetical protein
MAVSANGTTIAFGSEDLGIVASISNENTGAEIDITGLADTQKTYEAGQEDSKVTITAAINRLSVTILRGGKVYAVANSAAVAEAILHRGVDEYELFIGTSDFRAANIAEMVRAIASVLQ